MTLILACVTSDFAVQSSDRRVSLPDASLIEDRANKAIFFCHHTTWAYTGIAQVGSKRMDEWLVERFRRNQTVGEATRSIARDLTRALRMMTTPRGLDPRITKKIAVVGVGFAQFTHTGGPEPVLSVVSNFYDGHGSWAQFADRQVQVHIHRLGRHPLLVFSAGQGVSPKRGRQIVRAVRKAVGRGVGPHSVARLLSEEIQDVARWNGAVGANVMTALIARRGIGKSDYIQSSVTYGPGAQRADCFKPPLNWNGAPTYIYSASEENAGLYFSPAVVCPGIVWAGGVLGPKEEVDRIADLGPFPPYKLIAPQSFERTADPDRGSQKRAHTPRGRPA